jgi:cytochrome c oxidase subunit 2
MWNFPLLPERASTLAGNVDLMMAFVFAVLVFFSVLIAGLLLFFVLKYHHTTAADRTEPPTFDLRIELTWTAVPLALTALLFVWGARLFISTPRASARSTNYTCP